MSEVPATLGQRLKAEREKKGLSAQKAADELHLDGWVVEALEGDDYARVGPAVYAKGHLKRYAALLGLPAAEILEAYGTQAAPPAPASQPASMRMRTSAPTGSELPWVQIAGFAVLACVVAGVMWWKPWHARGVEAPVASDAPAPQSGSAALAPDSTQSDADDSAAVAASPAPPDTGLSSAAVPSQSGAAAMMTGPDASVGMGRARLRLSFSADSWVDVHDAAGQRVYAGTGRANSVKTLAGAAPLRVYLKSASGVQLQINDRAVAIGRQFVAGDEARFEAGADGVLRREARPAAAAAAGLSAAGAAAAGAVAARAVPAGAAAPSAAIRPRG